MEAQEQNSNKYEIYEREKQKIIAKNLPAREYEKEIAILINRLNI